MIAYIDTDILFFQNPSFFFNVLTNAEHTKNYFNRDARNAYVTEPDAINAATGACIMPFFNGGLWSISAGDLSPEKMNNWLGLDFFRQFMGNYLLEQTLTALIATNGQNGAEYLPPDYDVAIDKNPATSVCKHYVGKIRHGYELEGLQYIFSNRFS